MLDFSIKEQLTNTFSRLENPVSFLVSQSSHQAQFELVEMLKDVAETSDKISFQILENKKSEVPFFEISNKDGPVGISFRGVPGGHEFTSLVLSVLYADQKGRRPDEMMIQRIKNLKGPAHLKTYISLSCENCPDVVQSLNLIASLHPEISHEMVDGNMAVSEVESLGLQGVPAVVFDGKLISSGKVSFADLLKILEEVLGTTEIKKEIDLGVFDVAVVGGGPAGVTAAIYSVRKGMSTVLIADKIGGQVTETKGIENMISIPYTEGPKLSAQLGEHLRSYPVRVLEHRRVTRLESQSPHRLHLESGETLSARSVIIATGAKWRELGIPGEKEHIGLGVAFCAHCDGPFYKGKKVAVIGGGNSGIEAAIDLAGIASEVVVLEFMENLKADKVLVEKLKNMPNTSIIVNAKTKQVIGDGKKVVGLDYVDRKTEQTKRLDLDGVFVQIGLLPNTQWVKDVVSLSPMGEIVVDAKGRTSVPGIYAAGDVTPIPFKQIVTAMGDGAKVALTAFEDRVRS